MPYLDGIGDDDYPTANHVMPARIRCLHRAAGANGQSVPCLIPGFELGIRQLAEMVATASDCRVDFHALNSNSDCSPKQQLDVSLLAALRWRTRISQADGLGSMFIFSRQDLQLPQQLDRL